MTLALLAGLAAGLVHVFSGPDHLAAVAPLASDARSRQWQTGLQWGVGHTAGVLLIGLLLLVVREQLPIDRISAFSERLVGGALVVVGVWGLGRGWRADNEAHGHAHAHGGASFVMGTVHGLAGSSHLFGVLPALALPTRLLSGLYLAGFGLGAIAGMTAFAALVGVASTRGGRSRVARARGLLRLSSAAALVVGVVWLVG